MRYVDRQMDDTVATCRIRQLQNKIRCVGIFYILEYIQAASVYRIIRWHRRLVDSQVQIVNDTVATADNRLLCVAVVARTGVNLIVHIPYVLNGCLIRLNTSRVVMMHYRAILKRQVQVDDRVTTGDITTQRIGVDTGFCIGLTRQTPWEGITPPIDINRIALCLVDGQRQVINAVTLAFHLRYMVIVHS